MGKYYLGLDMGTSTVGWAVTDEEYRLIRKKGKDLWGVREFEEAKTSAERRTFRVSRRRRQREQVRIGLLKNYFADAIEAVDPNFYARLENSKYHLEDKDDSVKTSNALFADKEYFEKYPTIFHLRKELIHSKEPHDVREVFLALLNMYKHRGHFLNAGTSSEGNMNMTEAYYNFTELLDKELELCFPQVDASEIELILSKRDYSKSAKAEKLAELFGISKKQKREMAFVKTICGLKGDAKVLFGLEELTEKIDIEFSSFGYDEKEPSIHAAIGDDLFDIVTAMKQVYDIGSLSGILRGFDYLSEARIEDYEKHGKDLKILKKLMKEYGTEEQYNKMFRSEENGSYSAYVNSVSHDKLYSEDENSKHRRNMKGRKRDDFYATTKKIVDKMPKSDERVTYVLHEIEIERFMPKQLSPSNGVIPYQVHEKEMKAILKNAKEYLPFLNDVDESGLSVADRILKIFTFQVPYYVGPVSENSKKNGGNGWVVRKEKGQVLPWNIKDKIDMKKTSEQFISNMVRMCTYINGERVLPKTSLLYESYCVLNEINNLKIDNEKITVELKQDIYNTLFKKGKKVTKKKLAKYLESRGLIIEESQISGIDININSSLTSYGKFQTIFGEEIDTDYGKKRTEDIIFWCTVYGDSKELLIENIKEHYPEITEAQLKRITGMKFKDWGRLSKEFLLLQGCNKETGEIMSIKQALWETNCNLMELLSDRFTYASELKEKEDKAFSSLKDAMIDMLDEYYFSAPVKKMIWQTLGIIKEVEKLMGEAPDRVFIEMTRHDDEKGDKGRKASRKSQLLDLYKNIKDESKNWKEIIESADETGKLRSKKMYLYLTQ
ncbi:MAG: type II CRISPR RNA-guided endonuclease Cas9, partial [Eubacteriales bacterium]|nr:type II CRISPR RNA-guided endonuclease Cas9 [Eubacteriales bacterium]